VARPHPSKSPSPAPREREGPDPTGREGEGGAGGETLTRLASLATLSRGAGEGHRLGRLRAVSIVVGALALIAILAPRMPLYYVRTADNVLIYLILAIGLNMVVGYAGLLDLGFIAFYAIGAYSYAILASGQFDIHLPFLLVFFIGGGLAGLAGVLLGIPVLRLRGDYLAIVTLGFGEIVRLLLNNLDVLTNGPQGISRIDRPDFFGLVLQSPRDFFYFLLVLAILAFALVWRLERSMLGLAWSAVREDQDAARGVGINTTLVKLAAFGLSAMIGGFAGVVFSAFQRFVSPESFTFWESLAIVLIIVIGGLGNLLGVIAGALALVVIPELLRSYSDYRMLFYGAALVLIILLRPNGLVPRHYGPAWLMARLGWR
jgi:branched-chain amino acid transport system permease protein